MLSKIAGVTAAAAVGASASVAGAQPPAVQWRVEDGGNGHWYRLHVVAGGITWNESLQQAASHNGHLVACNTPQERLFINLNFAPANATEAWFQQGGGTGSCPLFGPWIGGFQDRAASDFSEPSGGWRWVTGDALAPDGPYCCNDDCAFQAEDHLHLYVGCEYPQEVTWNDLTDESSSCGGKPRSFIIEWSADCNNDGIVDYGQILDGTFADLDGNGIPDVCESPTCADADLFADMQVNGADLGIMLAQWGEANSFTVSDLNGDAVVDGSDLGILLSFWGPCSP